MKLQTTISIFVFTLLLCGNAFAKPGGNDDAPPTVDANIVNTPNVNVINFPSVQTVDGTVSVSNFPQNLMSPFSRSCVALSADNCSIDLSDLTGIGEVHIRHASGHAQNVGTVASPRFLNAGAEVLMPPTINTTDTGNDRDVVFSQSMDLIPVGSSILFIEPGSVDVYFYISGYVVGLSAANVAEAEDAGASLVAESIDSP